MTMDHRGRESAMSPWRVAVVAGAVTAGLLWAGPAEVTAQTPSNPPAKAQDRMAGGQDLEGRIRDVGNERITLDDGTVLFIPKGMAKQSDPAGESGAGSK
jgi:hypothetical protein